MQVIFAGMSTPVIFFAFFAQKSLYPSDGCVTIALTNHELLQGMEHGLDGN
jgi:hypothetical protein